MDVAPHAETQSADICIVEGRRLRRRIVAPRGCRDLERALEPWLH